MRECRTWPERGFPGYSQRAWWTDRPGVVFPGVSATGRPSVVWDAPVHRRCAGLSLPRMLVAMLRLTCAPNLALARLWADALGVEGIGASVQREFLAGVAGQLPPARNLDRPSRAGGAGPPVAARPSACTAAALAVHLRRAGGRRLRAVLAVRMLDAAMNRSRRQA